MARVPTASEAGLGQAQVAPLRGGVDVRADPVAFGAAQGQQIADAGQALSVGAARLFDAQQAVEDRNAAIEADERDVAASVFWQKRQTEAQIAAEQAGGDPGEFAKAQSEEFGRYREAELEAVKSPQARQVLQRRFSRLEAVVVTGAQEFEARQRRKAAEASAVRGFEDDLGLVYANPDMLGARLAARMETLAGLPLPAEQKEKMQRDVFAAMTAASLEGRVQRDPRGMLGLLQSENEIPGLELRDRVRLANQAETETRRLDAIAKAEQAARMQELRGRATFAIDMLEKGLQPAGLADLRRQAGGSEVGQALDAAMRVQGYRQRFALLPADEQAAELTTLRNQPQDPESFARLQAASTVVRANLEAINGDRGLDRAAELGVVQVAPIDITDPESVRARLGASRAASAFLGAPVALLRPEERAELTTRLAGLDAEAKANTLAQIQAAAGEAFPDVMRELGGKGGLDRQAQYLALLAGRPEAAPVLPAVGEAFALKAEDLKLNLTTANRTERDLERDVLAELEDWRGTLSATYPRGGGAQLEADLVDVTKRTAMALMRTHGYDEAVRMATEAFANGRYVYRDGWRMPKPLEPQMGRFLQSLEDTKAALTPDLLTVPGTLGDVPAERRAQVYLEQVRRNGRWATLPDESGLVLMDETGLPVLAAGRPVIQKFGGGF